MKYWEHVKESAKAAMRRMLRWLYWRYAAEGDPKLVPIPSQTAREVALPTRHRFHIISCRTGRCEFSGDHVRAAKAAFGRMKNVELWDGTRCRGRR